MFTSLFFIPMGLFFVSFWGLIVVRRNAIIIFMAIELLLLAVNFSFVLISASHNDAIGLMYTLIVLTVAAAESAIGLAILVVYYRLRGYIELENISLLKG